MCGILLIILDHNQQNERQSTSNTSFKQICKFIDDRGPEYQSELEWIKLEKSNIELATKASVLSFRSSNVQRQPITVSTSNNRLLFNGQIFSWKINDDAYIDYDRISRYTNEHLSDVEYLFHKLEGCNCVNDILKIISDIRGPFAFIYWKESLNSIFYGRDIFGRRSLCIGRDKFSLHPRIISSVCSKESLSDMVWSEIKADGIYQIEIESEGKLQENIFKYNLNQIYTETLKTELNSCDTNIKELSNVICPLYKRLNDSSDLIEEVDKEQILVDFEQKLASAVRRRILNHRRQCLECRRMNNQQCSHSSVAIAFSGGLDSTLLAYLVDRILNKSETIDLLNVAFTADAPDRLSGLQALEELRHICKDRKWNFVCCDPSINELKEMRSNHISDMIFPLLTVIDDSLGCALWFAARGVGNVIKSDCNGNLLIDSCNKNITLNLADDKSIALEAARICDINFKSASSEHVLYRSPASILVVGMGIDEQLGGYSSHRKQWREFGLSGVNSEIASQMKRISWRNLGRDDRVIACFGRDARAPYLDEELVDFLNSLPLSAKMNFEADQQNKIDEFGSKKLLRLLAIKFGFEKTAKRVKRAMQFGTRIAKLESRNEKGCDECQRL